MERKPQQQTLSIRISDALREFLERSKQVMSNGRGESVSTSDVAKILLESAKDDRLDFRLEVAELQQSPTQALWTVRRKWEQKRDDKPCPDAASGHGSCSRAFSASASPGCCFRRSSSTARAFSG